MRRTSSGGEIEKRIGHPVDLSSSSFPEARLPLFAGRCFPNAFSDGHCVTLCFTHRTHHWMIGSIAGEHSWAYIWDKGAKHDRFFGSLTRRAFRRGPIYLGIPPSSTRPDIYEIALWILSSGVLATSAIIIVVSLVSPQPINPKWLDSPLSPPHYSILHN
jgi:hypothetical protein